MRHGILLITTNTKAERNRVIHKRRYDPEAGILTGTNLFLTHKN